VTGAIEATIWGLYGGASASAVLTVTAPSLISFTLNPALVTGGAASTGTVILSVAAPAGGTVVTLLSGNPFVVTVPVSVTVPAGSTLANFIVSTNSVTAFNSVTIWAANYSAVLTVTPPANLSLSSLSLNPASVTGGTASTGMVTLSASAPAGGAVVNLSSSNTSVAKVPASVTVTPGATSASFTVSTTTSCNSRAVTVSGAYGGVTRSAGLIVTPGPTDTIAIQQADYFTSRRELRVGAKDTNSTATLRVYVTSTGELMGQLTKGGDGTYRGQFAWPVNPQNITVQSNLCGQSTKDVTLK